VIEAHGHLGCKPQRRKDQKKKYNGPDVHGQSVLMDIAKVSLGLSKEVCPFLNYQPDYVKPKKSFVLTEKQTPRNCHKLGSTSLE
jgi:hypothetical protein